MVTLENGALTATVNPRVGGTVTSVLHRESGLSVLGSVPWTALDDPIDSLAARNEPEWLTRYTGGWPLLFPNAGDACEFGGVFHGFHGEASVAPWQILGSGHRLVLERRFQTVPVTMRRSFSLLGESLIIEETLTSHGVEALRAMWGHHPTFGSDLLNAPFEITCGAAKVTAEAQYDPPANPLRPGAAGRWPDIAGKNGAVDITRPRRPWASLAYLEDFASSWAAIRRLDNAIAVQLDWDGRHFPCAWLWIELDGTAEEPWSGRTRLIGIEPNTTPCALGLAEAHRRGATLLRLDPGQEISSHIHLRVFTPEGPIHSKLT